MWWYLFMILSRIELGKVSRRIIRCLLSAKIWYENAAWNVATVFENNFVMANCSHDINVIFFQFMYIYGRAMKFISRENAYKHFRNFTMWEIYVLKFCLFSKVKKKLMKKCNNEYLTCLNIHLFLRNELKRR